MPSLKRGIFRLFKKRLWYNILFFHKMEPEQKKPAHLPGVASEAFYDDY